MKDDTGDEAGQGTGISGYVENIVHYRNEYALARCCNEGNRHPPVPAMPDEPVRQSHPWLPLTR